MKRSSALAVLFGGYEERVRFFLGLLVFVLASANAANFLLLRTAWLSLRDAVEDAVDARGSQAAAALLRAAGEGSPPPAPRISVSVAVLERIAKQSACLQLYLLDGSGRVILAADGSPAGTPDPDIPAGLTLRAPALEGISFQPSTRIVDREGIMIRYQAVRGPWGETGYIVKSVHDTEALDTLRGSYRTLVWTQAVAVLVVLIAAFAFGRWIARPYREIAKEAGAASVLEGGGGPEDLVAALRRVMAQMREQEEELRSLQDRARTGRPGLARLVDEVGRTLTSGLIAVDGSGRFVAANRAAGRILGWSEPPRAGASLDLWAGSGGALESLVAAALSGPAPRTREEIDHTVGTRRLRLGVSLSPVESETDGDGSGAQDPAGLICLLADLTGVRDLEDRVRRREQLAALGTVSAGIAHEVRNGLGTILGYARLTEKGGDATAGQHARAIVREVEALGAAVEEFLDFARPQRLVLGPVEIKDLIGRVLQDAGRAGLLERMSARVEGEGGSVRADEQALRQAFSNIVRNAAQSAEREVHLEIRLVREDGFAVVRFADDGDGIAPENLDRVFLPFFSTRGQGTGMGLALAQKTILEHEGTIEAASPAGQGASFTVRLPLA